MSKQHLFRQKDLIPEEVLNMPITVIGAGAIGSFTVLALAKMGFENITVFDDDTIEVENLNAQFYRHDDVGSKKVDALQEIVEDFTGVKITKKDRIFSKEHGDLPRPGVMITAVDNMRTRREVLELCEKTGMNTSLVIDPRMSAEFAALYTYEPTSKDRMYAYATTLFSDREAVQEPCTAKSTMYCVLAISSLVAATVKQKLTGKNYVRSAQWQVNEGDLVTYLENKEEGKDVA